MLQLCLLFSLVLLTPYQLHAMDDEARKVSIREAIKTHQEFRTLQNIFILTGAFSEQKQNAFHRIAHLASHRFVIAPRTDYSDYFKGFLEAAFFASSKKQKNGSARYVMINGGDFRKDSVRKRITCVSMLNVLRDKTLSDVAYNEDESVWIARSCEQIYLFDIQQIGKIVDSLSYEQCELLEDFAVMARITRCISKNARQSILADDEQWAAWEKLQDILKNNEAESVINRLKMYISKDLALAGYTRKLRKISCIPDSSSSSN